MFKRILKRIFPAALLVAGPVYADACQKRLMPAFTAAEAIALCTKLNGSASTTLLPQTDNTIDLGSASKQFRTGYFGTSVVNAGDTVTSTAAKGLVAGEASRAANVTTATTLAVPLYLSAAASGTHLAAFVGSGASTSGPTVDFFKTRATSGAATTIVNNGDAIGTVKFEGANGTTYDVAAQIVAKIDAAPGASADMPGSLDFQLSPDGSATPASVLKLTNDKKATFAGSIVNSVAASKIIPGATSLSVRNNADSADNLIITDAGATTVRTTLTATSGVLTPAALMETVAAAGTVQGNGPLTAGVLIHLVTGFDETKVVTLPACGSGQVGQVHFILNNTTNKFAKIFPNTSDQINSLGANNAYTQGVTGQGGKVLLCACQAATQWYCA